MESLGGRWIGCRVGLVCLAAAAMTTLGLNAIAEEEVYVECYDVLVVARIAEQAFEKVSDCGPGCEISRLPHPLVLDVTRVVRGRAPVGKIEVLAYQFKFFREVGKNKASKWWLRRNSEGTFNLISYSGMKPSLCAPDAEPAKPYMRIS